MNSHHFKILKFGKKSKRCSNGLDYVALLKAPCIWLTFMCRWWLVWLRMWPTHKSSVRQTVWLPRQAVPSEVCRPASVCQCQAVQLQQNVLELAVDSSHLKSTQPTSLTSLLIHSLQVGAIQHFTMGFVTNALFDLNMIVFSSTRQNTVQKSKSLSLIVLAALSRNMVWTETIRSKLRLYFTI